MGLSRKRQRELKRLKRSAEDLWDEQREAIEMFSTQLVNKILHYPILQLKDVSDEPHERESLRNTIRKIFGLR